MKNIQLYLINFNMKKNKTLKHGKKQKLKTMRQKSQHKTEHHRASL